MSFFGSQLLPDPETVIPTEFYDVRSETTPKAGWVPMYSFTALIYIAALVAFVTLFQNEASKSTTETVILPYDNTGNDGFTCQMISRVTATYQIPASTDPSLAYNLVNVMESKTKCQSNLVDAKPCSAPMAYFPGTATPLWESGDIFGAAAMYDNRIVHIFDISNGHVAIGSYDYSLGQYASYIADPKSIPSTTSLAVNRAGYPVYLMHYSNDDNTIYVRQALPSDTELASYNVSSHKAAAILNDNLYNIYVINSNQFIALDVYVQPAVSTVLFTLPDGDDILYAAVYHDGTSPTVYYYSTVGATTDTFYRFKDGVTTAYVDSSFYAAKGMVADGTYVYFCYQVDEALYYVIALETKETVVSTVVTAFIESALAPPAFAISPSGDRIFTVQQDANQLPTWDMIYLTSGTQNNAEPVMVMSGFGAEYFTCDDKLLNSTQYAPGVVAEYPQACESDGLVGKVIYGKEPYKMTNKDAKTYALNSSAAHCSALAAPICQTVAALPPYSCSRTLRQGFFACAATAVANAQFLVQVLVFFTAMLLPKLAKRFPVTAQTVTDGATSAAAAVVATSGSVMAHAAQVAQVTGDAAASTAAAVASAAGRGGRTISANTTADSYVEMAVMGHVVYDVENPLSVA